MSERITHQLVVDIKADIKTQLAPLSGPERLKACLANYQQRLASATPKGALEALVYGMSALVQHQREGGLSNVQRRSILESLQSILLINGVPSKDSNLSYLHEELYAIVSLIAHKEGDSWNSLWNLLLAIRSSPRKDYYRHSLGTAIRALRKGFGTQAIASFEEAKTLAPSAEEEIFCAVGLAKSLRLAGRWEQGTSSLAAIDDAVLAAYPELAREANWEKICLNAIKTNKYKLLISSVKSRGSHYRGVYCLEAKLWIMAQSSLKLIDSLPKMASIRRNPNLDIQAYSKVGKIVGAIEDLYDTVYPVDVRLRNISKLLTAAESLVGIDYELLAKAAIYRWLHRRGLEPFAGYVLESYRIRCRSLSGGKCEDSFALFT